MIMALLIWLLLRTVFVTVFMLMLTCLSGPHPIACFRITRYASFAADKPIPCSKAESQVQKKKEPAFMEPELQ